MSQLVEKAVRKWQAKPRAPEIYAIGIWTDPGARASAVNIDTRRGADKRAQRNVAFAKKEYADLMKEGDRGLAKLWLDDIRNPKRSDNPSDFEFKMLAEVKHRSFDARWGRSDAAMKQIAPLLMKVRREAARAFASFPLDPEAEIGVNSARSWYGRKARLKPLKSKVGGATAAARGTVTSTGRAVRASRR